MDASKRTKFKRQLFRDINDTEELKSTRLLQWRVRNKGGISGDIAIVVGVQISPDPPFAFGSKGLLPRGRGLGEIIETADLLKEEDSSTELTAYGFCLPRRVKGLLSEFPYLS